ncbi:uncharacterized protein LOC127875343 [Dreissena polymorpha]|uniref:uncharacterized protein LOC127875343 n=1 Tax=Dreissena polymorpha TaxID=45954 RepID=UPI0022655D87|nr:uncharacterized protein LOC127875343 [Dreissena polymorpha]XP_052276301.1 uncharacterized protein LOC127875343 [Dreissena polymorpha]XP_052276302.1 uncharacterized protein LOC127875343 [Dreissena polymorpha]
MRAMRTMVAYKAPAEHFSTTLNSLNDLRKDESLCDVVLRVGSAEIKAHKCVLAAGSNYFRSLFLGQFTESSKSDIDLSQVTTDNISMELIINFIYSGEVDIDSENAEDIFKLSSFFLIKSLQEFCADFMLKNLNLRNCLEYFLFSFDYQLNELRTKAELMVRARFHDYLINHENTLQLSPNNLIVLHQNNVMKHCSKFSLLQFLLKWLKQWKSDSYIKASLVILETLQKNASPFEGSEYLPYAAKICLRSVLNSFEKAFVDCSAIEKEDLLRILNQEVAKLVSCLHPNSHGPENRNLNTIPETSVEPSSSPLEINETSVSAVNTEREIAIFALVPRMCLLMEIFSLWPRFVYNEHEEHLRKPLFVVFAYVPRIRTWFRLFELDEDSSPMYIFSNGSLNTRFYVLDDEAWLMYKSGREIDMFSFQSKQWRDQGLQYFDLNVRQFDDTNESIDACIVFGNNGAKYMVVKVCTESQFEIEFYFKCYIIRDDGKTLNCIFITPEKTMMDYDVDKTTVLTAEISATSNELLVAHSTRNGTGWNLVFVANLNDQSPSPNFLKYESNRACDEFTDVTILEDADRFRIVSNGKTKCGSEVKVLYEYKFNSNKLIDCKDASIGLTVSRKLDPHFGELSIGPFYYEQSASDGHKTVWYMESDRKSVSSLTEVTVGEEGIPIRKDHPPPPFACFSQMCVGEISRNLLTDWNQASCYSLPSRLPQDHDQ